MEFVRTPPVRAFLVECAIGEWNAESKCLFARKRYFASSALFFHIFSRKREKMWPPEA